MVDTQELKKEAKTTIFNKTHKDEGKLSIFTGSEWLKLDGEHAEYIYKMDAQIEALTAQLEEARALLKTIKKAGANDFRPESEILYENIDEVIRDINAKLPLQRK
jgi:hypothetical protein